MTDKRWAKIGWSLVVVIHTVIVILRIGQLGIEGNNTPAICAWIAWSMLWVGIGMYALEKRRSE